MQREKRIVSGKLLEVSFFPIYADGRQLPRTPKKKKSTAAQEKYNKQRAVKNAIRLINTNFDDDDLIIHPTYSPSDAPNSEEEARRDIYNYIRRVKTKRESELKRYKRLLLKEPDNLDIKQKINVLRKPLKAYGRIERIDYKTGVNAGKSNYHFHICITGGLSRDRMEEMWPHRINADRFRPDKFGPESAARYFTKPSEKENEKVKIFRTRNLDKPKELKPKDGQISKRGVENIAKNRTEDKEYWEKRYPGYRFIRCFARFNEYNGNWYVTALMYKYENSNPPPWTISEWLDE